MLHSGSASWLAMRSLPVSSERTAYPAQLDDTLGDHALKPGQEKAAKSHKFSIIFICVRDTWENRLPMVLPGEIKLIIINCKRPMEGDVLPQQSYM